VTPAIYVAVSWLITTAAVGAAALVYGGLRVSRRRLAAAKRELAAVNYALDFATEKQAELLDRLNRADDEVMRLQGRLRAYELADSARRKARAN
jgi:hypothetical protein